MQHIITESPELRSIPKITSQNKDRIRAEVCLQTVGVFNRNKRRYPQELLETGLNEVGQRIKEGSFLGELDHPIDKDPVRQLTVRYHDVCHRILETGWSGNKLIGVIETLRTPNGQILKNLAEDRIPIGFSFRGIGDLMQVDGGLEVKKPLKIVTWDSVSYPSHDGANLIKITESVATTLHECFGYIEENGLIKTKEGVSYLPDNFDELLGRRIVTLKNKYSLPSRYLEESSWL